MPKKICISIAVSRPEKLDALPGAIMASHDVLAWARAAGFTTPPAVTDEDGSAVTVTRLNQALMPVVGDTADVIDHFIIHFAGHGIAADAEDQFLLLTRWRSQPDQAIRLSRFVRLLQYYQPGRVSLFIDACRSRPPQDADDLNGSGILDRPEEEPQEFLEDRFRAVVNATESYMIKDPAGGPARCLFTSVLLKALAGSYPEASEARDGVNVVTSASIYNAVTTHLPQEAARYRLRQTPSLKPSFVKPKDVYAKLPIAFTAPDLPPPAAPPVPNPAFESLARKGDLNFKVGIDGGFAKIVKPADTLAEKIRRDYQAEQIPTHFETGAGLAVNGEEVRGVPVVTPPATIEPDRIVDGGAWWRIAFPDRSHGPPASLAIELWDGSWIGAAVLPRLILSITVGRRDGVDAPKPQLAPIRGATSVIYRPVPDWVPDDERQSAVEAAESIISRLRAGALTGEEALSVATRVRGDKHIDPMLGAVAAYLYDAAGDRDSIRRLAWFYARRGEPIPFDVALLADLKGERRDGRLHVSVPAVDARQPRTSDELQHPDFFRATTGISDAVVAGGFPWLRQGWALLDTVRLPVCPALFALADSILPLPFTTLAPDAGRALANLIRQREV
ncbi:hypothetical protein S58_67340 [Bradyrhizobium oligotrophicum S58]|uniref:Uncharacterized protein n=1 Tax=Bradyrhizobium oligotrophicum S58 TaxID=1245469 RepID=M4ZGP5_9BRAD|nr:caspase family protein [Bradyrhizobium oligotrophicum]BAM92701.1 hypothetical protein S58_67340 [Bradyrhizobium oligotrophicum S58]